MQIIEIVAAVLLLIGIAYYFVRKYKSQQKNTVKHNFEKYKALGVKIDF